MRFTPARKKREVYTVTVFAWRAVDILFRFRNKVLSLGRVFNSLRALADLALALS